MTVDEATRKKIYGHYQRAEGSLQDLARIYRVSVDEVLEIVGHSELGTVTIPGDLIDQSEAGPGAQMNYGRQERVPFTVD